VTPTFDLDALRTMVLGNELGSFAQAAVRLGRSQSALSMQLKKLEQQARQPLFRRKGRGIVPTDAGEVLLAYARRMIALNDEAAGSLGAAVPPPSVRMGLPQDFFDDVMPDAITRFSQAGSGAHVEVRAGRNYALHEEIRAGRLDVALAFFPSGSHTYGEAVADLPLFWFCGAELQPEWDATLVPLVMFDHPCLFRQTALQRLDADRVRWRLALTTPALAGVWAALRAGYGVSVRTAHNVPMGVHKVEGNGRLPKLPAIGVRLLCKGDPSPAVSLLRDILLEVARTRLKPLASVRGL
jgi:DNA-binding transcriptional LysR family regulator